MVSLERGNLPKKLPSNGLPPSLAEHSKGQGGVYEHERSAFVRLYDKMTIEI